MNQSMCVLNIVEKLELLEEVFVDRGSKKGSYIEKRNVVHGTK